MLILNYRLTSILITVFFGIFSFTFITNADFKTEQLKNSRVKDAYKEKESDLKELYKQKSLAFGSEIFLRAFKKEGQIELWAQSSVKGKFKLVKMFNICNNSGSLGPKRKQGDNQTPEGFYHIDRFNPSSAFHLSLGVNYPNTSDKILGEKANYGGDIFIHGSCVTIGCIPLTNDKIKEVYISAVEAKSKGQEKIQVHIFPCRLTEENFNRLKIKNTSKIPLLTFWENLKPGYDYFEKNKLLPVITVNKTGKYLCN